MKTLHRIMILAGSALFSAPGSGFVLAPVTTVETKVISVPGFPGTEPSHTVVSNYGHKPSVILGTNADNSSNVAFLDASGRGISILSLDAVGNLTGRIDPVVLQTASELIGFTRIPSDGSFAISHAKNHVTHGADYEYWVSRVSASGATIFSTRIFGGQNPAEIGSKGEPGAFSSGRLAFNPTTQRLIAYTGHTERWSDNVRHQGGHVMTVGLDGVAGVVTPAFWSTWYCSHNFDQRLLVDGNQFYTLAHGDAFPRSLVFGRWQDGPAGASFQGDTEYFAISGSTGNNTTNTQTGGMVKLTNGNFCVVYTTRITRNNFDVRYVEITPAGVAGTPVWLTSYPANTFAIYPRIARHGDGAAIFWEEVRGGSVVAVRTKLVGTAEANATPQGTVSDAAVRLPAVYDIASLQNGGILWASARGAGMLALHRVAAPPVLLLRDVVIARSGASHTIRGRVTGGVPLTTIYLQASSDLGFPDAWQTIATIPLDASGQAVFGPVMDPGGSTLPKGFFRLNTVGP